MTDLIYGLHAVEAALRHNADEVTELWLAGARRNRRIAALEALARAAGVVVQRVERAELDALTQGARHQGAVARCMVAGARHEDELKQIVSNSPDAPLLLVLDGVQDPHNLGACLRSADAAGVHAVVAPRDRAVGLTPTVRKVATGAAERVPFVQVTNLARTLGWLKDAGVWVVGTAGEVEQTLYETDLRGPLALILGAEGKGMRRLTRERCDMLVRIPMHGSVSSLNVSVAAGVVLFEAVRQRTA